jgi:hypothetical protein
MESYHKRLKLGHIAEVEISAYPGITKHIDIDIFLGGNFESGVCLSPAAIDELVYQLLKARRLAARA